jgi:hypothetical protein
VPNQAPTARKLRFAASVRSTPTATGKSLQIRTIFPAPAVRDWAAENELWSHHSRGPITATADRLPGLIADFRLVRVEAGPHNIGWTHPEEVNKALLEFVDERDKKLAGG